MVKAVQAAHLAESDHDDAVLSDLGLGPAGYHGFVGTCGNLGEHRMQTQSNQLWYFQAHVYVSGRTFGALLASLVR